MSSIEEEIDKAIEDGHFWPLIKWERYHDPIHRVDINEPVLCPDVKNISVQELDQAITLLIKEKRTR